MTGADPVGDLEPLGRISAASNATFLARDAAGVRWVYKPVAGERPLWDFPVGTLGRREVAASLISDRHGFGVVPRTVWGTGPFGEGSLQRWVEGRITDLVDLVAPEDLDERWLPVASGVDADDRPVVLAHRDHPALRRICLFDLVINNSDRKAGHIIDDGATLFGVDHGVSLGVEEKPRTVLWGFRGLPLDDEERRLLAGVADDTTAAPEGLSELEWEQVAARARDLLRSGVFPAPSGTWPAIPWPPW